MSIIDLIVIMLFIIGAVLGYRRGFILQLIAITSYLLSFFVAFSFYSHLLPVLKQVVPYPWASSQTAPPVWFTLFDTETIFYSVLSFSILFIGTKLALHILGHILHAIAKMPGLHLLNRWLGGGLGFIKVFILVFITCQVLLYLPWETGKIWLYDSKIAIWMTQQIF